MANALANLISRAGAATVTRVRIRSQVTPDYETDPFAPPGSPQQKSQESWLMEFVKPEITVETAAGPVTVAPYGAPTSNYFPLIALGAVSTVIGAVVLIGWIARKLK